MPSWRSDDTGLVEEPVTLAATARSSRRSSSMLVASSNADVRRQLLQVLKAWSRSVGEAAGGAEALAKLEAERSEVLLLDRRLSDLDATELLATIRRQHPDLEVVVFDSQGEEPILAAGSRDSFHGGAILRLLEQIGQAPPHVAQPENSFTSLVQVGTLSRAGAEPLPNMIGASEAMKQVYRLARLVAPRSTTVLVSGETGTGKELVARAIHLLGPRSSKPFITVNCAAIPEPLLEAELFGYARGAFTGAFQSRVGRIHAAHGGTLFLDEVGELPLGMQAKLLRFLQEGEVQRLGSADIVRVDARVVAATNADLLQRVENKVVREDLYYRISVFPIDILPLRSRQEDILPLGIHFLHAFCQEASVPAKSISPAAQRLLEEHTWPGNVRELRHVMERAFILSEESDVILPQHIRLHPHGSLR